MQMHLRPLIARLAFIGLAATAPLSLLAPPPEVAGSWSTVGSLIAGRAQHTATRLLDGRVLVTGGTDGRNHGLASTELFDPRRAGWQAGPPMSSTRIDHTATLLPDGRVLVAGGIDQLDFPETTLASTEIYAPSTNRWTVAASMLSARERHTATLLSDGMVLVVGGLVLSSPTRRGGFVDTAELYDPSTNRWSLTGPQVIGVRQGHTATRLLDGRVLVVGGEAGLGPNPSVELYDPRTTTWSPAATLLAPHVGHTATRLTTGEVLIAGGAGSISPTFNEPEPLATVEVYDPTTDHWSLRSPMHSTRDAHTATLLTAGKILVVGGAFTTTPLPELFDPAANRWLLVAGPSMNRHAHTATLLLDGRVLVAGGYSVDSMSSTLVYDAEGKVSPSVNARPPVVLALVVLAALVLASLALRRLPDRLRRLPSRPNADEWIDP